MNDREARIRDLAYSIWEEAGRPQGQEDRHWDEAQRRYAAAPPAETPLSDEAAARARRAASRARKRARLAAEAAKAATEAPPPEPAPKPKTKRPKPKA
ncbi:DUF2934 domain-containing protein [Methylopila musalis]|uniref:DUF2934 domain-containing protein n=1 Tax=Methylopila musalis TaxID=1134781 RepID=A0ABW3Z2P0_9HYPH